MLEPTIKRLHGALTAVFTPLDTHGSLALELMPALLDFQRAGGMDGVVVCGTNGEGTSLSVAERRRTLEVVMEHRGNLTVLAGTGAASVTDVIELTRHAAEVGADGTLVLPPFFFKNPDEAGLAAFFRAVLDSADLPVLLYNIPQFSAVAISAGLLDSLASHPNLAGVKDSAGDWARTLHLIQRYPALSIFPGSDLLAAQGWANGAAGGISGGANAFPELAAAVRDAHRSDAAGATPAAAQTRLSAMTDILRRYAFISAGKSVLAQRGGPRLGVRPPLVRLSATEEANLIAELQTGGFL